jgi:hypothetical protein
MTRAALLVVLCTVCSLPVSAAQQPAGGGLTKSASDDDVAPPSGSEVIARSPSKRQAIIRATQLSAPLRVDGRLDEDIYTRVKPVTDFIQTEPVEGLPATEQTEVWIFYDRDSVYVCARLWDSHLEREVADEMRRDNVRVVNNENFAFTFDTFHDRRTGYDFELNPLGGRWDGEIANDGGVVNGNFNPVWEYHTGRFEHGWTVEARIPFKSIRVGSSTEQEWGFQARRMVRWKNELSFITRIPAAVGQVGHLKVSLSPTLIGLEAPHATNHLEVKPYATASVSSDATVVPRISNDASAAWGGDVKYPISRTLTVDGTYNTDFAQVEADLQQVNLTRFNLFFPEQRDFFLENSGVFTFGGATTSAGVDNTPLLFYSRRIGLAGSSAVPIIAGGRLSGRVGRLSVGVLQMATDSMPDVGVPRTNFSVVRVKRDVFRRSSIGMIFTNRSIGQFAPGSNQAYGVDGQFILTNTIVVNTFWARTATQGLPNDNISHLVRFDYEGDRYGLFAEHLTVGKNFNPDIGFVRHPDLHRRYLQGRFSPRPRVSNKVVRKFYYNGTYEYIQNGGGRLDTRTATGEFAIDFQNADHFSVKGFSTYEFLPAPLALTPAVSVPAGGYNYGSVLVSYNLGPTRPRFLGNVSLERGTLYGGDKTILNVSSALVSFPPHLVVEPTYSLNEITLPEGSFTTHLLGPRFTFMATPLMFVAALVQYNNTTHTISSNVRFRWEYQPGSELFVVWNEQRGTFSSGPLQGLQNRAFIVKITHLFRF